MELRHIASVIARTWPVVAMCALLGLGTGWLVTTLSTPIFQAHTQLFVSVQAGGPTTELNQGSSFTLARVQSYVAIATSSQITESVRDELHLPGSAEQLASRISAQAPLGTVLVNITVSDTDRERAALTADAVARRFRDVVQNLETPDDSAKPPVKLNITQSAAVPAQPSSPRPALNLAAGLLAGLLLGAASVVVREALDNTIATTESLTELTALPVLGAIPHDREGRRYLTSAVGEQSHSPLGEAIKLLRTNLRYAAIGDRPRVLVVTSALPLEGKSSTALSLALSMAEAGTRTVLVDADLRRPCVAEACGLVQDAGLTNVLIGNAELADVMQQTGGHLAVLTSGPIPPNPAELLASARMGQVLAELAEHYEAVIVDSAPLLPVADTVGLAPHAQAVLLVVRAGKTPRDRVAAAADALRTVGVRTLGAVLTMVPLSRNNYGDLSATRSAVPPQHRAVQESIGGETQ